VNKGTRIVSLIERTLTLTKAIPNVKKSIKKTKKKQDEIVFFIDNMFVQSSGRVFQQRLAFQLEQIVLHCKLIDTTRMSCRRLSKASE
jgi:rRNA processing protein Krr1/Pno1